MAAHILIIEDNHQLAESLVDILEVDDYTITTEMTGRAGLDTALSTHPDLIILDIHLPDLDGYRIYQRLQQDDWGKKAKILVLTASESLENIAKNINIPVDFVLFKPDISVSDLRTVVKERLSE
jgi:two-component system copper resistance phosphate regulon response regulator CusR